MKVCVTFSQCFLYVCVCVFLLCAVCLFSLALGQPRRADYKKSGAGFFLLPFCSFIADTLSISHSIFFFLSSIRPHPSLPGNHTNIHSIHNFPFQILLFSTFPPCLCLQLLQTPSVGFGLVFWSARLFDIPPTLSLPLISHISTMATHPSTRAKASLFLALTLSTSMILAEAQSTLQPVRRHGFVQIGDKFYIQGGFSTTTFVQDFFVIDLASSWAIASPTIKSLPAGQLTSHHGLAAVGGGAQVLAVGGLNSPSSFVRSFDLATQKWTNVGGTPPFATGLEGHAAVTDPATGQVYIIGGNNIGSSTVAPSQYNGVMVYDPTSTKFATQQPATNTTSLTDPGVVWSTVRKSILVFGGSLAPPVSPAGLDLTAVREYDPVSKSWKTMVSELNESLPWCCVCSLVEPIWNWARLINNNNIIPILYF